MVALTVSGIDAPAGIEVSETEPMRVSFAVMFVLLEVETDPDGVGRWAVRSPRRRTNRRLDSSPCRSA